MMTQDDLTRISDEIASGTKVDDWGGERYLDIDTLSQLSTKKQWQRKSPNGLWKEIPAIGGSKA